MRKLIGLVAALAALGCFVAAASATAGGTPPASNQGVLPPSGEHCESGSVCVWKRTDYEGERTEFRCTFGVHSFGGEAQYSAKNRCPERRSILTERAEAHYVCMNPGTNEERPGKFYEVVIGNVGEDC